MAMNPTTVGSVRHARREHQEVCPLCLGHYSASAEQICVACEAPSCPDCVEPIAESAHALCYACHQPTRH